MRRQTFLFLLLLLPACTAWQPVTLPTPETTGWTATGRLRVTTHWGTLFHGDSAWIAGDTLMLRAVAESTTSVATSRIAQLERHGLDGGRTVGLGLGAAMLSMMVMLIGDGIQIGGGDWTTLGSP